MGAKLARIVYRMLKYGQEYVDKGNEFYEEKYRRYKAAELGFQIVKSCGRRPRRPLRVRIWLIPCAKSGSWRTRADLEVRPTTAAAFPILEKRVTLG